MFNLGRWEIIAILLVVVLIFGGKKLRSLGSDIGAGIKGFKKSVKEDEPNDQNKNIQISELGKPISEEDGDKADLEKSVPASTESKQERRANTDRYLQARTFKIRDK